MGTPWISAPARRIATSTCPREDPSDTPKTPSGAPEAWVGPLNPHRRGAVGPPRSGFVLRVCIRKADPACVQATLADGLADTRFFRERSFDGDGSRSLVGTGIGDDRRRRTTSLRPAHRLDISRYGMRSRPHPLAGGAGGKAAAFPRWGHLIGADATTSAGAWVGSRRPHLGGWLAGGLSLRRADVDPDLDRRAEERRDRDHRDDATGTTVAPQFPRGQSTDKADGAGTPSSS